MATLEHRHVSAHEIDRLLAGVLPPDLAGAIEGAERACEHCRERLTEARRAGELFLVRHPPRREAHDLLDRFGARRRRQRLVWALPALSGGLAALFLLARPPSLPSPDAGDGIVAKGGAAALDFSVVRAGSDGPRPGRDGEVLRRGDALALELQIGRFRGVHLFSVGKGGEARFLFDWSPSQGGPPPLLVLDGAPEPERIVALFHDLLDPGKELPRLRTAIASRYLGRGLETAAELEATAGSNVVVRSILIRKENIPPTADDPDVSRP